MVSCLYQSERASVYVEVVRLVRLLFERKVVGAAYAVKKMDMSSVSDEERKKGRVVQRQK